MPKVSIIFFKVKNSFLESIVHVAVIGTTFGAEMTKTIEIG